MFGIGTPELVVILLIALIVLGPKKLPEIARAIGKGMKELQKTMRSINETVVSPDEDEDDPDRPVKPRFLPEDEPPKKPTEDEPLDKDKPAGGSAQP
jgi:TatA/E family protein of Tat protein translocase